MDITMTPKKPRRWRATLTGCLAAVTIAAVMTPAAAQPTQPLADPMRGRTPVGDESVPPPMHPVENKDLRRERAYSMQPPTIPHKIDGYQVDKRFNRCLDCHAREKAFESRAVPLSVTHYMDRTGNVLGEVSPRRYFCNQCHVSQVEAKPLVPNDFRDIADVLRSGPTPARKP